MVKELPENACAEAVFESSTMRSKDAVRLCITGETKDQEGRRIEGVLVVLQREQAVAYLLPDRIEDQI